MIGVVSYHDIAAGVVAVGLLVGVIFLAILQQPIPQLIETSFTVAITWTFRGGIQAANELRHQNRRNNGP